MTNPKEKEDIIGHIGGEAGVSRKRNTQEKECHCSRTSRYHTQDSIFENHSVNRCWTDKTDISTEKARWREEIKNKTQNILDHHEKEYPHCERCIEIRAYNQALEDILEILKQ